MPPSDGTSRHRDASGEYESPRRRRRTGAPTGTPLERACRGRRRRRPARSAAAWPRDRRPSPPSRWARAEPPRRRREPAPRSRDPHTARVYSCSRRRARFARCPAASRRGCPSPTSASRRRPRAQRRCPRTHRSPALRGTGADRRDMQRGYRPIGSARRRGNRWTRRAIARSLRRPPPGLAGARRGRAARTSRWG